MEAIPASSLQGILNGVNQPQFDMILPIRKKQYPWALCRIYKVTYPDIFRLGVGF
jgi:hypothetical protein